jgi:uncharacterized protein (TIGR03089 family)
VATDPARPLLTWYSPAERTELSGATLANWVNKTANLLVDELGLGAGSSAVVDLPPHWQTSSIMLACWTAGLAISHRGSAGASGGDVSFGLPGTGCDYVVGLHPLALPVTELSGQERDWVLSARAHGDRYGGPPADPGAAALTGLPHPVSHADLASRGLERAAELAIGKGDRVLIDVGAHPRPLDWLAAPIAAGASLVLCQGVEDLEKIAATERAITIP